MASLVYYKNPNGTTYVYENISYWDKELKKPRHKRKILGHLDPETGEIVPNRKKGDAAKKRAASQPEKETPHCTVQTTGVSKLLDKAVDDTGLKKVLSSVFPEEWSSILTCAYYLVSEGGALCHADKWKDRNIVPFNGSLSSQRITELLKKITPTLQQEFFRKWVACNMQDTYYAMDITSVSSYSEFNELEFPEIFLPIFMFVKTLIFSG